MVACKVTRIAKKKRWKLYVLSLLVVMLLFSVWLEANIRPIILTMAEAKCRALSVQALHNSISEVLAGKVTYEDLMTAQMDNEGRVSMLSANTNRMNALSAEVAAVVQKKLANLGVEQMGIPLGSALGSKLLAGEGPRVPFKVYPIGSVTTDFYSEFESSGINQTRHKVFLTLTATVQIIIPTDAKSISVSQDILVAESIIVGRVPESYYMLKDQEDLLNVVQ